VTSLATTAHEANTPVPCPACRAPLEESLRTTVACRCGTEVRVVRFRPTRKAPLAPARAADLAGTPCAYHAGNAASSACARCGSFLCELCATPLGAVTYCTACFERMNAEGRLASLTNHVPRPHALALLTAFMALFPVFGLVFVPIALWQGVKAVRQYGGIAERERAAWVYLALAGLFVLSGLGLSALVVLRP
jgi:hypothetical protein